MEKKEKTPKAPKEPKAKKSKNMPEGYIGRPKPMKTKKFEFHKPTVGNWIGFGVFVVVALFITYIVLRLIQVSKVVDAEFDYYAMDEAKYSKEYVLENSELKFDLDPETTQFTVLNKKTGKIWYSNPQNVDSDVLALTKEKNNMKSTFLIKYSTVNGNDDIYDTYTKSIKKKFYDVEKKGNEILVNYTVGDIEREYIFPLAIYQDELEKYEEGLTKSQIRTIDNAYHKYTIDGFKTDDEKSQMLVKYPELENQTLYLVFDNLKVFQKEQMEKLFAKQGYTAEDYERSKEMYKEQNMKTVPAFNLSVSYKLDKNNLVVEIPFDQIKFKHTYPIVQVSVLPYFGAAGADDKGFMLVPEGGGSIINFNNGKTRQNGYYADLYGWDYATDRKSVNTETRVAYPVFGISDNNESVVCIIKDGSPYAGITADIAGKLASYNYVRADYKMLHREQFDITTRNITAQYSYEVNLPEGEKISQIYSFSDKGSYVDMAKIYRDYLFKGEKKTDNKNVPVAVDIIGAIDKVQQVGGVPKTLPYELTSYKAAAKIINQIDEAGVKDANIRLTGFINEGVHQTYLKNIKYIKELGGTSGFNKLLNDTKDTSAKLYLDAAVQTAFRSTLLGEGFNRYKTPARFVSDEVCKISQYSPIWYGRLEELDCYYLLNPKVIAKNTDTLIKTAEKNNIGVSFADNGYLLSGDYNEDRVVSRLSAANQQVEKMKIIKDKGLGLMIRGGNDYAVKHADFITDLSLKGNDYAILDYTVPFYQIALHGYRNFAGPAVNIGPETEDVILQSAETGAGLYFTFTGQSERRIQETNYSEYYATCFDTWKDKFVSIYNKYNSEISKVSNSCISDFEYVKNNISKTTFENGYSIYVNYGYSDYTTASGKKVPARDYIVVKMGE